jgi:hypothetical protein
MNPQKTQRIPGTFDEYIEQMPPDLLRALKVWLSLSEAERAQLSEASAQIKSLPESERKRVPDIITNIPLGPYGKPCPYCGRER